MRKSPRSVRISFILIAILQIAGCRTIQKIPEANEKILIGAVEKGWLEYKVYRMPDPNGVNGRSSEKGQNLVLSIMIINRQENVSPLRKLSKDLAEYNTYYEYLLNRVKDDVYLSTGTKINYPVSYSFENNYNAFPFETINVGYHFEASRKNRKKMLQLVYIDKIFAQDTLRFELKKN